MKHSRCHLPFALTLSLVTGCTVVNSIDVCERGREEERPLNARNDGDQYVLGANSIATLPSGSALVVFTSNDGPGDMEVRWRVVGADGVPRATCEAETEYTYEPPAGAPVPGTRFGPVIAGPRSEGDLGLVAFIATDAADPDEGRQLWAQAINTAPCPEDEPFLVRDPGGGAIGSTAIVGLTNEKFVVIWQELEPATLTSGGAVMARVLRARALGVEVLPTVPSADGAAVSISVEDRVVASPAAVAIGDLELAVAWLGIGPDELRVWLAVLDDRLVARVPPRVVARQPRGVTAFGPRLGLATDGAAILVVWSVDAGDGGQAYGLPADVDGNPTGDPIALGAGESNVENAPVAVGLPGGGYLVAWESLGNLRHEDQDRYGIRAMALGSDGTPRFTNPACGAGELQMNRITEDDQVRPALARLRDGSVLSAWSDFSPKLNPVDSGIVLRLFRPRDLLPLE